MAKAAMGVHTMSKPQWLTIWLQPKRFPNGNQGPNSYSSITCHLGCILDLEIKTGIIIEWDGCRSWCIIMMYDIGLQRFLKVFSTHLAHYPLQTKSNKLCTLISLTPGEARNLLALKLCNTRNCIFNTNGGLKKRRSKNKVWIVAKIPLMTFVYLT